MSKFFHLDLFSGVGGFAYAAQQVWGDEYEPVAFCEIDPYCQRVLRKHWPEVEIIPDIFELSADAEFSGSPRAGGEPQPQSSQHGAIDTDPEKNIDLLTGGFPCQPFSVAGSQDGRADSRHLWPEMARCIGDFKPRWVVGENVTGILAMEDVLTEILSDLGRLGYDTRMFVIPAAAVGAHHRRDRVWLVAHSDQPRLQERQANGVRAGETAPAVSCGAPGWAGGDWPQPWPVSEWFAADAGSTNGSRRGERIRRRAGQPSESETDTTTLLELEQVWPAVGEFRGVADGVSAGLYRRGGLDEAMGYVHVTNRTARLKALGNAIVPQVAMEIFRAIRESEAS
jgi:DNA (cytosine-5)-methyltransferase 1